MQTTFIGIDPGVTTGVAVSVGGSLIVVSSTTALDAMNQVLQTARSGPAKVWWEDARKRNWFGAKGREALQGAGSIKRDCSLWEEFFARHAIQNVPVAPQQNTTKLSADQFRRLTGWVGRTNEHGRDAAMLIVGRK